MVTVSVIVPTFNCATYLGEAIESVLTQTYQDFEIIVIDDGSTDNTRQVLEPYLGRITYHYQENQGESVARNCGIQIAHGQYIAFLDSDDFWYPDKLALQVAALEAVPDAVLSYGYGHVVDARGCRVADRGRDTTGRGEPGLAEVFAQLAMGNIVANINTVVVRRHCLIEANTLFDPAIRWGEDWDLWLRLALQGPFHFTPQPLACCRTRKEGRRLRIEAAPVFVEQNETILRKVFALLSEEQVVSYGHLLPQALQTLYLRSAMYNFELGNDLLASEYLARAVQTNPSFAAQRLTFARRVAHEGFRIAMANEDFAIGVAFVKRVFTCLPLPLRGLRRDRSQALAELYMAAAFTSFERQHRGATLRNVLTALSIYPPCARNLGLLSIGLQSVLGRKLAFWSRGRRHGEG